MLEVRGLSVAFGRTTVVTGVDLDVPSGAHGVGLVGESGSGKTTIARCVVRLLEPSGGSVTFDGTDVTRVRGAALAAYRRRVQVVLQDPDGVLDPRMRVGPALTEVLRTHRVVPRGEERARAQALLDEVGLPAAYRERYPHQLSGGERQRVAVARALAVEPELLVLDEPTSALDVTVQERVLTLLERLRDTRELAYLLISHNLAVVGRMCETIVVLYLGRVVEAGPTRVVLGRPAHPYTAALRSAIPTLDRHSADGRIVLPGIPANPADPPSGCVFHPRCPLAVDRCRTEAPHLTPAAGSRRVACHRADDMLAGADLTARTV